MAVNQIKLSEIYSEEYLKEKLEKGGIGSGRKRIKINSPMASHSNLHGKTFDVEKESEHEFASGKKKYYHIKDDKGNTHEIKEDFAEVQKGESFDLKKSESTSTTIGLSEYNPSTTIGNNPHLVKAFTSNQIPTESEFKKVLDEKLQKGIIDSDLHKKATEQLSSLMKAKGEGSRGGHVIGHTKSGKPVYADKKADHKDYKNFTSQDHKDAAELHSEKHKFHAFADSNTSSPINSIHHRALMSHHSDVGSSHAVLANEKEKEEHEKSIPSHEKQILADQKKKQIEHHENAMKFHEMMANYISRTHGHSGGLSTSIAQQEYERHQGQAQHHKSEAERLKKDY